MTTHLIPDTLSSNKIFHLTPVEFAEVQRQAAAPVIAELTGARSERDRMTEQLVAANETIQRQQATMIENEQIYGRALEIIQQQGAQLRQAAAELDALKKRIAELEPPPVVVVPEAPKPEVEPGSTSAVYPFCAIYVEDPRASDSVDDQADAKAHADAMIPTMEFAAECPDIDSYITFLNPEDVKHGDVIRAMQRLKKRWWQSPIQAYYIPGAQNQAPFIDHLKRLHDAGVDGVVADDANNLSASDMEYVTDMIHRHIPGAPIMASFLASFDDHTDGYPHERYIDMRQWFLRNSEKEGVWFNTWETAQDAEVWAADVWRRKGGFMHTPERLLSMAQVALPMVKGIAFYSMLNRETNHMLDHQRHVAEKRDGLTMWAAIRQIAAQYQTQHEKAT